MKKLLWAAGFAVALAAPGMARAEAGCDELKSAKLAHAEVTAVSAESQDGKDFCKVSVTSRPTRDSEIGIEVWIPRGAAWNGRFVQLGNGGFAGSINSKFLQRTASQGYAVAGTDNGHRAMGTDAAWALGHPEKLVDYGWRSLKETTDIGKALVRAQKEAAPKQSYFVGCSDGGREALMEAQRFPADFDGIVAGAPANYMSLLFANGAAQQQALSRPGAYLDKAALETLQAGALRQCGGGESFIRDPGACRFDPKTLICKAGQASGCLTPAQAQAAADIYAGRRHPRTGKIPLPGISPGAEALAGGWQAWVTGPDHARNAQAAGYQFSSNAFKYFAFGDPSFDFLKMDLGATVDRAKAKMSPIIDSESANLAAFRKRGGKLIQYHGWNDPAIPARSSIVYAENLRRTMGDVSDFYRLYLVPGMLHCGGGASPSTVDWLATLDTWVTDGKAPAALTATAVTGPNTQLLCPHPGVAKSDGKGGWSCPAAKRKG